MTERPVIAILVFPDTTASLVYGLYDLFLSAGRDWGMVTRGEPGPDLLEPLLVARTREALEVCNGIVVQPHITMDECPDGAVICVPEVNRPPGEALAEPFAAEIAWLRERYRAGATLAASCSGAMLFAEAGLLDGWEATTHWAWCDVMAQRFPRVAVRAKASLVTSGDGQRLVMAGGGTSWFDLALYLIGRLHGCEAALQVARVNLIDWHHVGQQPFAHLARSSQVEDAVIADCQTWIAEHYPEPHPVATLVRRSGLAERTFKRRFRAATGLAPLEYVHALRLEEAKQMLEAGDEPVEAIANAVGYEDAAFFGRLFRRKVNLTPAQYRKRFGQLRRHLAT